jgi:hypothetical protein
MADYEQACRSMPAVASPSSQPNIWQDNFLTGSTPFAVYPRLVSAQGAPVNYGFKITPAQLPTAYTPAGQTSSPTGKTPKKVPANTVMDVDRYEKDLAALTPAASSARSTSAASTVASATRTSTPGRLASSAPSATSPPTQLRRHRLAKSALPRTSFPNAYPGASPGFAPDTQFDAAPATSSAASASRTSSRHRPLQLSRPANFALRNRGARRPGIQASYTWGKSIDDTSQVIGGTGSTGAVPLPGFSAKSLQHASRKRPVGLRCNPRLQPQPRPGSPRRAARSSCNPISRKVTGGWELLSISSISSGSPFTVYSGIQQTGYGSNGVDRPDQIGKPASLHRPQRSAKTTSAAAQQRQTTSPSPSTSPAAPAPTQGRFGTLGRNTFRGPAYYDYDFALIKDTPFGAARAEPSSSICSSAPSSSTSSTSSTWACPPTSSTAPASAKSAKPPAPPARSSSPQS